MNQEVPRPNETEDRVPLFGTWRKAYLAVVIFFVVDVVVFYAFSRYFS
ncbi:MAG: hypothetical protein M3128_11090 [Verrucomicrobiota bacterium]|nr:hypothetical protein [Verrucomicrobiota bacterium]